MTRNLHSIGLLLLGLAVPAGAAEFAVLRNGAVLPADRHEISDGRLRLYSEGGLVELPLDLVERFDPRPDPAPAPAAAPVPEQRPAGEAASAPAPAVPAEDAHALADQAALKFGLPAAFVHGVMKAESAYRPGAVSPKGALGLMQLMPDTARQLGVDPRNPRENAEGGARYLRELLARYENDPDQVVLALAAYNAGPAAVERYHGVPPFRETREYILRVLREWESRRLAGPR